MTSIPERTLSRLSLYRQVLEEWSNSGESFIFSHQLAQAVKATPAQIRRDLDALGD